MKSLKIEVYMGAKLVKTFTVHDFVEGRWKWSCSTVGMGGTISTGYMQGATALMEIVQGQEKQIGFFTVSIHEIKQEDVFKVCLLISKPGEPENFLTLDCKCIERMDMAPQEKNNGGNKNTKTIEQIKWETEQIRKLPL